MMMSNLSNGLRAEKEETPPVIYMRYLLNRLYCWSALKTDLDLSDEPRICLCGAKATLSPCFVRTDGKIFFCSSIAAVGSKIYTFGGYEGFSEQISDQVSCIDTLFPEKGWKLMNTKLLTPVERAYTVTIDVDRVLLIGGLKKQYLNPTLTQMYYPKTDNLVPLVNTKITLPNMHGHGVVLADDNNKNRIPMHSYQSEGLFSYNIDENCWDLHYQTDFETSKHTAALVDGIYYVLDFSKSAKQQNLLFTGYDISKKPPSKRLPVEVMKMGFEKEDDELMPKLFPDNYMAPATLLSLGNSKLAMIWRYNCVLDDTMMCVWCSVFKMTKEFDAADGALKLVAQALSNSCYHVEGHLLNGCLVVHPSKNMDNLNANRKRSMIEEENEKKRVHLS